MIVTDVYRSLLKMVFHLYDGESPCGKPREAVIEQVLMGWIKFETQKKKTIDEASCPLPFIGVAYVPDKVSTLDYAMCAFPSVRTCMTSVSL